MWSFISNVVIFTALIWVFIYMCQLCWKYYITPQRQAKYARQRMKEFAGNINDFEVGKKYNGYEVLAKTKNSIFTILDNRYYQWYTIKDWNKLIKK